VGVVVESGCKPIYNDQKQYFLDLTTTKYGICTFTIVGIPSTYLYFWSICDTGKIAPPQHPHAPAFSITTLLHFLVTLDSHNHFLLSKRSALPHPKETDLDLLKRL